MSVLDTSTNLYRFNRSVTNDLWLRELDHNFQQLALVTQTDVVLNAPFTVQAPDGTQLVRFNADGTSTMGPQLANVGPPLTLVTVPGDRALVCQQVDGSPLVEVFAPGPGLPAGTGVLTVSAPGATAEQVEYLAAFTYQSPPTVGNASGVWISAGTNANDSAFNVESASSSTDPAAGWSQFFMIKGDGSGTLGNFHGTDQGLVGPLNGLVWDSNAHFSLSGGATFSIPFAGLSGVSLSNPQIGQVLAYTSAGWVNANADFGGGGGGGVGTVTAPFTVLNAVNAPLFEVMPNGRVVVNTEQVQTDHNSGVTINGSGNTDSLQVIGGQHTEVGWWALDINYPPNMEGSGKVNGLLIAAGTTADDSVIKLEPYGSVFGSNQYFFHIAGDGSGRLGPPGSQIVWDAQGHFGLTGGASLPLGGGGIGQLSDVNVTPPVNEGQTLIWDGTQWINSSPELVAPVWLKATTPMIQNTYTLRIDGPFEPRRSAVVIYRPARTVIDQWDMQIGSGLAMAGSGSGSSLGCSNGLNIAAGTDPTDRCIRLQNDLGVCTFFEIYGDGHGAWTNCAGVGLGLGADGNLTLLNNAIISGIRLESLADVNVTGTPTAFQTLVYDPNTGMWVNGDPPLADLGSVSITNPQAGQVLTYDGASWVNEDLPPQALSGLSDVQIVTPLTDGEGLVFDAALNAWTNKPVEGGTPGDSLSALSDVTVTGLSQGEVLTWDTTLNAWTNLPAATALAALTDVSLTGGTSRPLLTGEVLTFDAATEAWMAVMPPPVPPFSVVNPQNGQVLTYNSTTQTWMNAPAGAGGVQFLSQLADVSLVNPDAHYQALTYNPTTLRWENGGPLYVSGTLSVAGDAFFGGTGTKLVCNAGTASFAYWVTLNQSGTAAVSAIAPFRVFLDRMETLSALQVRTDGSGYLGPFSSPLTWNAAGNVYEVPVDPTTAMGIATKQYVDAAAGGGGPPSLAGTPLPIAFAIDNMSGPAPFMNIPITVPLTIPAGLTGSVAMCSVAPTGTVSFSFVRRRFTAGSWQSTSCGGITFNVGSTTGVVGGVGNTFIAGDVLSLTTSGGINDATIAGMGITIQATRA